MTTPIDGPSAVTGNRSPSHGADVAAPFSWAPPSTGDIAPPPPVAAGTWAQPPSWQPPVTTKKRMVWPWVVAGSAVAFVVLIIAAIGYAVQRATADQNADYAGAPITSSDVAETGDFLIVSDSGDVAFEGLDEWYDISDTPDITALLAGAPPGATVMGVYFTSDPYTSFSEIPEFVVVLEAKEPNVVGSLDVERLHDEIMTTALTLVEREGDVAWSTGPFDVTTASGLEGFKSQASISLDGLSVIYDWYTFARKDQMVSVQIVYYSGAPSREPAGLILGSLRIDR